MQTKRVVLIKRQTLSQQPQLFVQEPAPVKPKTKLVISAPTKKAEPKVKKITVQLKAAPASSDEHQAICRMGEIDVTRHPHAWAGWQNGSCINSQGAKRHIGRHLELNRRHHMLRWNPISKSYLYVGNYASFLEGWDALRS